MAAHTELKVWQLSMTLAESVYALTAGFPREELYGLTSQMRRASVSIPSNIAEGYGREQRGHIINFLRIAMGSCRELETQLKLSVRLKFCNEEVSSTSRVQCDEVGKMLRGLIRSVEAEVDRP
jgi:four helix bundle protein